MFTISGLPCVQSWWAWAKTHRYSTLAVHAVELTDRASTAQVVMWSCLVKTCYINCKSKNVEDPENDFRNIWERLEIACLQSLKCLQYSQFAWKARIWFHRPTWSDAGHQSVWGHLEKSSPTGCGTDSSYVWFHELFHVIQCAALQHVLSFSFVTFIIFHHLSSTFPLSHGFRGFNPLLAALAQMCWASHALSLYQLAQIAV